MPGNLLILLPGFTLPRDFAGRVGFGAAIEVHRARKLEVSDEPARSRWG
jgi:hypothetical protein